jgi:hypothetical protein
MPQEIKTVISDAMAAKIEAAGKRLHLTRDQVLSLGLLIAIGYGENIKAAERDEDIRAQLADVLDMHHHGVINNNELVAEVRNIIDLDSDATWTPEVEL